MVKENVGNMPSSKKQKAFISYVSGPKFKSDTIALSFKSYIPLERKFKIEDLFEFKRKDGDLFLSFICLLFAGFIIFNFSSETGWEDRALDHKRFGKILKQPWVGPLACVTILLPAALLNILPSYRRWIYKKRNLIPSRFFHEFSIWVKALEFIGYFLIYTLSIRYLGYFLSTVIFGVFLTNRLGYTALKWQIRSILTTIAIVLIFRTFLKIKTPVNIWLYEFFPQNTETFMKIYF